MRRGRQESTRSDSGTELGRTLRVGAVSLLIARAVFGVLRAVADIPVVALMAGQRDNGSKREANEHFQT